MKYFLGTLIALLYLSCADKKPEGSTLIWLQQLPPCPCENPDRQGVHLHDGWAKDEGDISVYHAGATECFRSYPPIKTAEGWSGQQCCYDEQGHLITAGSAAGTPDKVSTCDGESANGVMTLRLAGVWGHLSEDVNPWKKMGWQAYNLIWIPNSGSGCDTNTVIKPGINQP